MSRRTTWLHAVTVAVFPVGLRPVKATLLALPVDADGIVTAWREDVASRVGLPRRTLDRHLSRACDAGWLAHVVRGGHGRKAVYEVQIPDQVARQKWQTTKGSCAPRSTHNSGEVVRHVVAESRKKTSASVSEHQALDARRIPESHSPLLRVVRNDGLTEDSSDREAKRCSLVAALSPGTGRPLACARLRAAAS